MLLLVPGDPGESYWKSLFSGRFVYGVLPLIASAILLALVGWLWARFSATLTVRRALGWTFSLAASAIVLFWAVLIILVDIRNGA